jgi:hypothetical protein
MTFAGSLFLVAVGAILWQWAVWSRRSRQSEVLVDDRRRPPDGYRDPRY